ncbi:class I SAM-dependent methyltransferase [Oxalobacteraceae sp. CFBP 13730]|nr:class I SAM-dependent methyltransferase [Oxalobacteraceae sp. CFBP 13730]
MAIASWLTKFLNRNIVDPIDLDPRTVAAPGTFLGWPKDRIFTDVLGFGQASFDTTLQHLSGRDRAMLYARYNQPRHLDELTEAFTSLISTGKYIGRPTILDLGCGPFTAGLAFAGVAGPNREFRYYGVDISNAMLEIGQELFLALGETKEISDRATCFFSNNLDQLNFGKPRGDLTLVVASYLLASPSLDVPSLVKQILNAAECIGPGPVAVLYTNSALPSLNVKYPDFKNALCGAGFILITDKTETFYETKNPKMMRYALFFRPANTEVKLQGAKT